MAEIKYKQITTYGEFERRIRRGWYAFAIIAGVAGFVGFVVSSPQVDLVYTLLLAIPVALGITGLILCILLLLLPRLKEQFRSTGRFSDLEE